MEEKLDHPFEKKMVLNINACSFSVLNACFDSSMEHPVLDFRTGELLLEKG